MPNCVPIESATARPLTSAETKRTQARVTVVPSRSRLNCKQKRCGRMQAPKPSRVPARLSSSSLNPAHVASKPAT
ncbi:hypothetical protein NDU88_005773 [Pleurodeles waltl]|uniref:Uncharacterized protein n=1 Tax=Pleurodeles waltl TaxID=8319 RepID=A0AAV7LNQ0_PLEWA|nr:hypothetical protein NDU88_005773 [Pleurodeles waltl]